MKKVLLVSVVLFASCICTNAQLKGKFYLGGNAGLDVGMSIAALSDGYEAVSENVVQATLGLNFTAGFFISDKWRIGAYYDSNGLAIANNGENAEELYYDTIGLGLAYYKEIARGFYYVPEIKICSAWGEFDLEDALFPLDGYTFNVSLLQLEYKPTEHFSTSVNIGYLNFVELGGATTVQGYSLGLAMGIINATIGINPTVTFKYFF